MTDTRYRPTLRIDLHTAMGDPQRADPQHLPDQDTLRRMLQTPSADAATAWHLHAYRRYLERDFEGAVHALKEALRHMPNHKESLFLKGVCLQLMGLSVAERHTQFPHRVPPAAYQLLSQAEWTFRILLDLNPSDQEARTYLQGLEALLRPLT